MVRTDEAHTACHEDVEGGADALVFSCRHDHRCRCCAGQQQQHEEEAWPHQLEAREADPQRKILYLCGIRKTLTFVSNRANIKWVPPQ